MNKDEIFKSFDKIETERLRLRYLDPIKDAKELFVNLYSDPEITKFDSNKVYEVGEGGLSIIPTMSKKMLFWQHAFWAKKLIVWGIELKETGELIGTRFCEFYSMGIANLECKLSKKYWRKGIMYEATNAIIDFLEFHDVLQIITTIHKDNTAAINLDKKLGFTQCSIDDLYFTQNIDFEESISLQGLVNLMQDPSQLIFVRPKIAPQSFSYFEQARHARKNGDLKSCAILNSKAHQIQPDFIHALNGLGWAKLDMGDPLGAISDFNRILSLKPKKYSALLGRAYAYADLQQFDESVKDLNLYLSLIPDDGETYVMLGNYFFQARMFRDAIDAYEKALAINPNDQEALQYKQTVMSYL